MTTNTISQLPLHMLRESPINPRLTYHDASLAELADSIRRQGVLQPIIVRPIADEQHDLEHEYEIVFGHRRYRASQLAGQATVPALVRAMTDQQVALAQVAENLQREDVNPLEEAEGLARLRDAHSMSPPQIALAIGKSMSFVYNLLRLANASDDLRQAMTADAMPREVAVEVARLKAHPLQRAAIAALRQGDGWQSYRATKATIAGMFKLRIHSAPFDPGDATLTTAGACRPCPALAGNDEGLGSVLDADTCTNQACYQAKVQAHTARRAATLRAQGRTVLQGDEAKAEMGYANYAKHHTRASDLLLLGQDEDDPLVDLEGLLHDQWQRLQAAGLPVPEPVYIEQTDGTLGMFYRDADAELARKNWMKANAATATAAGANTPNTAAQAGRGDADDEDEQPDDRMAGWTPAERAATDGRAMQAARCAVIKRVLATPRSTDELRDIVLREVHLVGELDSLTADLMGLSAELRLAEDAAEAEGKNLSLREYWTARLASMTADQLAALVVGIAIEERLETVCYGGNNRPHAQIAVAVAARYGVDLAAVADELASEVADEAGGQ